MTFHAPSPRGSPSPRFDPSPRRTVVGSTGSKSSPRRRLSASGVDAMEILRQENEVQKRLIEAQKQELAKLRVKAFAGAPAATNATSSTGIEVMRKQLVQSQATVCDAQDILASLLPEQTATSRAGYLQSLPELIGPPPQDRTWEDEWVPLKAESYRLSGQGEATVEEDLAYVRENDDIEAFCGQTWVIADIQELEGAGWPPRRATIYTLLFTCVDALARALRDRDSCYAASTYALSESLFAMRRGGGSGDLEKPRKARRGSTVLQDMPDSDVPALYVNRHGLFSVTEREPAWERIEIPDGTGFRGLTSSALTHASCDPNYFCEAGFQVNHTDVETGEFCLSPQNSDIICFESAPDDEHGAHAGIITSKDSGDFPPNTL